MSCPLCAHCQAKAGVYQTAPPRNPTLLVVPDHLREEAIAILAYHEKARQERRKNLGRKPKKAQATP